MIKECDTRDACALISWTRINLRNAVRIIKSVSISNSYNRYSFDLISAAKTLSMLIDFKGE